MNWTESGTCQSRAKCGKCRDAGAVGRVFRAAIGRTFLLPGPGLFACPHKVTADQLPPAVYIESGCGGDCGKQKSVAEIKSSPAAIEAFLAGEA